MQGNPTAPSDDVPQSPPHDAQSSPSSAWQAPSRLQAAPHWQSPGQVVHASPTQIEQKPSPHVGGGGQSMMQVMPDSPKAGSQRQLPQLEAAPLPPAPPWPPAPVAPPMPAPPAAPPVPFPLVVAVLLEAPPSPPARGTTTRRI
jgi:homeobox protein ESX1